MGQNSGPVEFLLGGVASAGAAFFTNPLEVVKTRMQLQGELKAKDQYVKVYRNVVHAFLAIAKADGLTAIQSGLVPAIWYQFVMNGCRLGSYQVMFNMGLTKDHNGNISFIKSVAAGAVAGCIGSCVGSPLYMVKTHLQAQSTKEIAVGHQHPHTSMTQGLREIYAQFGVLGLWRGVTAAVVRVTVGSAAQLSSFSVSKSYMEKLQLFKQDSFANALSASMLSGVVVCAAMTPFDVVSTRLYNQGVSASGQGLLYTSVPDCFLKIFRSEGLWGFYKGWAASYFRIGPHTVLSLVLWDEARKLYSKHKNSIPTVFTSKPS